MRALDLAAGAIIASVVVVCVGAVVFSAREAGRGAGRRLTRPASGQPSPQRQAEHRPTPDPHRRAPAHPPPELARRRERAAARPRRRD